MALSDKVTENLKEAEGSLRNALHWAAKNERPIVCKQIANLIHEIDHIGSVDGIIDMIENRKPGSNGRFGISFDDDE